MTKEYDHASDNSDNELLAPIETVALPSRNHTENFIIKVQHLMKFEIGQSILVGNRRTSWQYAMREVTKETGRKYRFLRAMDGLRLVRES